MENQASRPRARHSPTLSLSTPRQARRQGVYGETHRRPRGRDTPYPRTPTLGTRWHTSTRYAHRDTRQTLTAQHGPHYALSAPYGTIQTRSVCLDHSMPNWQTCSSAHAFGLSVPRGRQALGRASARLYGPSGGSVGTVLASHAHGRNNRGCSTASSTPPQHPSPAPPPGRPSPPHTPTAQAQPYPRVSDSAP